MGPIDPNKTLLPCRSNSSWPKKLINHINQKRRFQTFFTPWSEPPISFHLYTASVWNIIWGLSDPLTCLRVNFQWSTRITSCALCALRDSTNVTFLCDKCWHFRNSKLTYYLLSICQSIHITDLFAINFQSVVYFDKGIMLHSCMTIAKIFAIANLFNICYNFVVKSFNRFACFSPSICHILCQ